jgi:hypothetical protein
MTYGANDDHDQDAIGGSLQKLQASADFSTDNGLDYLRHVGALQPKSTQVCQPPVTRPLLPQDPDVLLHTQDWRDLLQRPPPTTTTVNESTDTANQPTDAELCYRAHVPPEPNESNAESRQRQSEIDSTHQALRQEHLPPVPVRDAIGRFANGSSDDSDIAETQRFESSDASNDVPKPRHERMNKKARKRAKAEAAAAALLPPPRLSPTGRALDDDEELCRTCNVACSRHYVCISCKGYLCQGCYTTISPNWEPFAGREDTLCKACESSTTLQPPTTSSSSVPSPTLTTTELPPTMGSSSEPAPPIDHPNQFGQFPLFLQQTPTLDNYDGALCDDDSTLFVSPSKLDELDILQAPVEAKSAIGMNGQQANVHDLPCSTATAFAPTPADPNLHPPTLPR